MAGCGIHNNDKHDSVHDGIHRFYLDENSKVKYIEKHYGSGKGKGKRILNPVTEIEMKKGSSMTMDSTQIKGVDSTLRVTKAVLDEDYLTFEKEMDDFEKTLLFSGEYDHHNALLEIHPGAGGTESQDWASMLMRMYQRYADKKGWKIEVLDYLDGEEAGLKSVSLRIVGYNAYGHLKAEKGVHRLVRISPFDASKRRHTSFASVDVMPEFDNDIEIEIDPHDIRIDTYRASGAGGQHINKTDSAIRITHLPTNIVVTCQSQRSQIQNREQAMIMLKSKLYQLMLEKQASELNEIKGEQKAIEWGSQIRSYVLHPYSMVKDNRSGYESNNPKAILDGDLDECIYAYLKSMVKEDD